MRKKILLLAVLVVASATTIDAQRKFPFFWKKKKAKTEQTTPAKKESEYDKLFKKKHETAKGLITLHLLDGKVYFELPVDLINKDMLIGSTVTSISDNGNAVVGSKPTDLLHVMFTRNKTLIILQAAHKSMKLYAKALWEQLSVIRKFRHTTMTLPPLYSI